MHSSIAGFGLALAVISLSCEVGASESKAMSFAVGQRWEYRTRPQDSGSTLVIVKIDEDAKFGRIISISVSGIHIGGGPSRTAKHMPFSEESLRRSVTNLSAVNVPLPDFKEGYDHWHAAYVAGRGGFYTIEVADAVQVIEETAKHGQPAG